MTVCTSCRSPVSRLATIPLKRTNARMPSALPGPTMCAIPTARAIWVTLSWNFRPSGPWRSTTGTTAKTIPTISSRRNTGPILSAHSRSTRSTRPTKAIGMPSISTRSSNRNRCLPGACSNYWRPIPLPSAISPAASAYSLAIWSSPVTAVMKLSAV